jgi:uncharacterized protein YegL
MTTEMGSLTDTGVLGGAAPTRDLHFIFLADCSGSMSGSKIAQLNTGIEGALPEMRNVVANRTDTRVLVRAIRFSDTASWHVTQPTPLEQFRWHPLHASGATAMGEAIRMAVSALEASQGRQRPPALVLVSDGVATDDVDAAIKFLDDSPWGKRAVRRAVAIGDDADRDALRAFIGNPEVDLIEVSQVQDIAAAMRFVSVGTLQRASRGRNSIGDTPLSSTVIPIPGVPTPSQVPGVPGASAGGSPTDPSLPPSVF